MKCVRLWKVYRKKKARQRKLKEALAIKWRLYISIIQRELAGCSIKSHGTIFYCKELNDVTMYTHLGGAQYTTMLSEEDWIERVNYCVVDLTKVYDNVRYLTKDEIRKFRSNI